MLPEEMKAKPVKEARILTPSRVMLPPHTPHFIYFNPSQQVSQARPVDNSLVEEVSLSPVPVVCLTDPSIQVCEYDETSYPHHLVSSLLDTFSTEMRLLLKYVKPTMLVSQGQQMSFTVLIITGELSPHQCQCGAWCSVWWWRWRWRWRWRSLHVLHTDPTGEARLGEEQGGGLAPGHTVS